MILKPDHTLEKLSSAINHSFIDEWLTSYDARKNFLLVGDPEGNRFTSDCSNLISHEEKGERVSWVVKDTEATVGIMWIDLVDLDGVEAPSLHVALNASSEVLAAVIKDAIRYVYSNVPCTALNSRHRATDSSSAALDKKVGFEKDGDTYEDDSGQKWQNISLAL